MTGSVGSDTLPSIIKVLDVAEKAVYGLPIYGPRAIISSIRAVLQSVKVRVMDWLSRFSYGHYLRDLVFLSNQAITKIASGTGWHSKPLS